MTTKQLDMSFDAMNLRDNGPGSPMDHHQQHQHQMQNQQQQYQQQQHQPQHQRRYSQYGSERGPTSPLTRKNTGGHPGSGNVSQRNSMGMNGMVMGVMNGGMNGTQSLSGKRPPNRLSVANMNWSPPQATPLQSPVFQQDPRQQQQPQYYQTYAYQPMMQPGPLIGQFQPSPYQQQPLPLHHQLQQPMMQPGEEPVETIPTAIVIKNIPFQIKRESLLAILDNLDIPKPYALNYHFDNGVFRGLAFANYRTAEETDLVYQAVNGLDVQGRKLRVEFKKVMPAAEQEKRDQEKAAAAALAAQEALQRREAEIMEAQLQEQQQERQERQRELMELQNREFERTRNRSSAALLERRDSGRSLLDRDEVAALSLNQLDLNDGETLAFYDRLLMFRGDSTKDDMVFPENLSARQRRILHLIADKLSLHHFTEGEGNLRRLIIMKTPPASSVLESAAHISPGTSAKQRPMSFAGRGSLRSDSPIYKSRTPLPDIPSGSSSSTATPSTTIGSTIHTNLGGGAGIGGGSSVTSNYTYTSTTMSSGSASPTRSLYRRSIVFDVSSASGTNAAAGNLIYPVRQPKGPEPGKMFTIRDQKHLRDATMIKPAFALSECQN